MVTAIEEKRFMAQWNALAEGKWFMVKGNAGSTVNKFMGRAGLVESRRWAECGSECGLIDVDQSEMALKGWMRSLLRIAASR